jgi:hypothetical protein
MRATLRPSRGVLRKDLAAVDAERRRLHSHAERGNEDMRSGTSRRAGMLLELGNETRIREPAVQMFLRLRRSHGRSTR